MAGSVIITSYNLHGFNVGQTYLQDLCRESDIVFVQETWLSYANMDKLASIDRIFLVKGVSAMENELEQGLLKGRPYGGGIGCLWRKSLSKYVKILKHSDNFRCLAVQFNNNVQHIIMFGVYLPHSGASDYEVELLDTLGFICSTMDAYAGCKFIICGDFNFEFKSEFMGYKTLMNMLMQYNLSSTDHLDVNNIGYTYVHESLDHLLDHFVLSSDLNIGDVKVLSDGRNLSDHLALSVVVNFNCKSLFPTSTPSFLYKCCLAS
jgi:hypothetical protein